ncbi:MULTISPECIES: hypothetical protein [unclassified Bradyrhizobium]|uniref:hypothetical protein n=1 Tax=unclassified Bradyrhizobium TaxID=2631580 RepID=UPI001BAB66AB|nr:MULTISPECIES: hypothetical protein [unclassified Bradyrhizobium]MBR1205721.1 hypothetical protein [Bradyrhizobium sp. AUGA SZCCT0124]MBR1313830.1 hypothetical protein [Bradyrhizobium sp. AUGA SZCCT0051]MBR1338048.1 hypothetical protein [Bradyrhizobium sp. AUGA SZCCT0105]MBR1355703.1 hypothetical protein [Bradyrhizobium sp. AUGA SZCCT0045]
MIKALLAVMRLIWTVLVVGAATLMGAVLGWGWHGWIGAISLGIVGFGLGSLLAACPEVLLELVAEM